MLSRIQRDFNNFISNEFSSNEIAYDFTSIQIMNLRKSFAASVDISFKNRRLITRQKVSDAIAFDQMNVKFHYDRKHESLFMKIDEQALIRLHKSYNISFFINRKYDQQYVRFFIITKKIERLIYRFDISDI